MIMRALNRDDKKITEHMSNQDLSFFIKKPVEDGLNVEELSPALICLRMFI